MNSSGKLDQEIQIEKESTEYFFHFTDEIKHLESIMNNYFMPFYCMECIEYLNLPGSNIEGMAYPVVCFCDLPVNRQKEHKKKFGEYGIGMKKEWGIKNFLTPIVYSHSKSMTAVSLRILIDMANLLQRKLTEDEFRKFNISVSILMMHYKAYEGKKYIKNDKLFAENYDRFYDEREWRYIPRKVDGLNLDLEIDEYQNDATLAKENKIIQRNNRLRFDLNDIEFLFLKSATEIDPFLSRLRPKYNEEEIKVIRKKIQPL